MYQRDREDLGDSRAAGVMKRRWWHNPRLGLLRGNDLGSEMVAGTESIGP
ncbi:hypothetical protein F383_27334 [Gossypium arboreum]|uniref:Uncharacterized protein n=1 Tax=Gossypium arboreum TaxID=29729 RepID=A0A0B0MFD7_GOSAR|nr:hypothetical protein F383_37346 [Gossypium arboreum]KHG22171.1 hypothetical protein F383_27334 [Gossypium arboreum]